MNTRKEFVLTNGVKFIRVGLDGKYRQTNDVSLAERYSSQKAATNIMLNSLSKSISRSFYVAELNGDKLIQCCASRPQKPKREKSVCSYSFDSTFDDTIWSKCFVGVDDIFEQALKRGAGLAQELSDIDAKIVDLEHYIEFTALNAVEGYLAYKQLRVLLRERRCIKYEQKVVNAINSNRAASENISNILSVIQECKKHEYKPRILPELFENGITSITSGGCSYVG